MMQRAYLMPTRLLLALLLVCCTASGCMTFIGMPDGKKKKSLEELAAEDSPTTELVGSFTHTNGMDYVKIESVALVTGLRGTGEDPPATPQRAAILSEMKQRQVENPNAVLSSLDTAIVNVKAFIRPGAREGDRIDVEVRVPNRSETTSLRGGWMLPTRMTPLAVLGGQIHSGHVLAIAEGPILIDPLAEAGEKEVRAVHGRILGGGVVTKSRDLGLVIDGRRRSYNMAINTAKAINQRFYVRASGRKQGVANPKSDEYIELAVADRYRDNIGRYIQVIRNMAVNETSRQQQQRIAKLSQQIMNPMTAASSALQLEAIGSDEAIAVLNKALESPETEVRFYAAEALAYLDQTSAVEVLAAMARHQPAFRVNSFAALSAMDDLMAYDALRGLLSGNSAETRYGAFRSLWAMNSKDAFVAGEGLGEFSFHVLPVEGPPMIHLTNSLRPEIVIFGQPPALKLPLLIEAGSGVLINGMHGSQLTVSHFAKGTQANQRVIEPNVELLIRTIVDLGGTYPDVVQALQEAKQQGALEARLSVDALPESGRQYRRDDATESEEKEEESSGFDLGTPLPDLFKRRT